MNSVLSTVMQQIHLYKLRPWPASVTQLLSTGDLEVSEQDGWDHEVVVVILARAVTIWRIYRGWTYLRFSSMLWQPISSSELTQKEKKKTWSGCYTYKLIKCDCLHMIQTRSSQSTYRKVLPNLRFLHSFCPPPFWGLFLKPYGGGEIQMSNFSFQKWQTVISTSRTFCSLRIGHYVHIRTQGKISKAPSFVCCCWREGFM